MSYAIIYHRFGCIRYFGVECRPYPPSRQNIAPFNNSMNRMILLEPEQ